MVDTKYILRYLPLFYEELEEKVVYITQTLKNPQAANALLDSVESAILERLPNAESFVPYRSLKERKYLYYRIYVKNFVIKEGSAIVAAPLFCVQKSLRIRQALSK